MWVLFGYLRSVTPPDCLCRGNLSASCSTKFENPINKERYFILTRGARLSSCDSFLALPCNYESNIESHLKQPNFLSDFKSTMY